LPGFRLYLPLLMAAFALPFLAVGCGSDDEEDDGKLRVVATTAIIGALTEEVAGDLITLKVLAPEGVDPHDYELTANDQKDVDRSALVLRNGLGFDEYLDKAVRGSKNREKVVVVTRGIELIDGEAHDEHEEEDEEHGDEGDPHVWHDPIRVKVMVTNIAEALASKDPTNAETYRSNAAAYHGVLDETDRQIRQIIDSIPPGNRKMVTNHDAFGYFIERYDLTFVGAVIPATTTAAEPSARQLAALQDTIKKENVKAIFAESSVDPRIAQQIARDTNIIVVDDLYGDSLGERGTDEGTVHGMLLWNARKIAEALK
jgi:zinc/manganese transport system substrate-binding protein